MKRYDKQQVIIVGIKQKISFHEITEVIKENSIGFTKGMEVLTTFDINDAKEHCYMFFRRIEDMK